MLSARDSFQFKLCHQPKLRLPILSIRLMGTLLLGLVFGVFPLTRTMAASTDPSITVQPLNQHRNLGESVSFVVTALGTPPLQYQWRKNDSPLAQATNSTLTLTNLQATDGGSYSVVVSNETGHSITSAPALLTINLAVLDAAFRPGIPYLFCIPLAIQSDGKILFGGSITSPTRSNFLARLNFGGTRDSAFHVVAGESVVTGALQEDGMLVVGGTFTNLNGQTRNRLGRVRSTGTIDTDFTLGASGWIESQFFLPGVGILARQANGKILAGGSFTNIAGLSRINLARLEANGSGDNSFSGGFQNPSQGSTEVACIAFQSDGKFLVGGAFTSQQQPVRANLIRYHSDGTFDSSFNAGLGTGPGAPTVSALAVQADGRILVGSRFTGSGTGYLSNLVFRLHADGALDTNFNPKIVGSQIRTIRSIALQCDGRIIVGGSFVEVNGIPRTGLVRLHPNGALDHGFTPEPWQSDNFPNPGYLLIQADGNVLVAGSFSRLAGQSCTNFGRLLNPDPATQNLSYDGSSITWLRGGSSPEVHRTTFDYSTNGVSWSNIGSGSRVSGGWQDGVSIPLGGTIRARGYIAGNGGRSNWFVETSARPAPVILSKDPGFGQVSNRFGFPVLGWPGHTLVVEDSTNLIDWTPVATNVTGTTPFFFLDTNWLQAPHRFYRARAQ